MKKSTLFITLGLLAACSGKPKETKVSLENKEIETEIPVVDLASVINQQVPDTFTWNSIAKNIQLIPISTSNKTLMGVSRGVIYMGEDYYIIAEYQTQNLRKEISLKDKEINSPLLIKDNYMVCRGNPESPYQLYITDNDLNIRQSLCPFDSTLTIREKAATHLQTNRCNNMDMLLFNHAPSDSVFTVTDKGLTPLFILKKGKYAIPSTEVKNFINLVKQGDPHILSLQIHSIPGYYLICYLQNQQYREEIWRKSDNQIISRFISTNNEYGYPVTLPSGKTIRVSSSNMYNNGNKIALFIPAEDVTGEIEGVKEDDNPVLLIMDIE